MNKRKIQAAFAGGCLILAVPALAQAVPDWNVLLKEGNAASARDDYTYAIYKYRKAWLSVPRKELSEPAYKVISDALNEALAKENGGQYRAESIQKLDEMLKNREELGDTDAGWYVRVGQDDALEIFRKREGFDTEISVTDCTTGKLLVSPEKARKLKEDQKGKIDQLLSRMPIIVRKNSPHYEELAQLCGKLKPGENKAISFDLNPFIPRSFKYLSDL